MQHLAPVSRRRMAAPAAAQCSQFADRAGRPGVEGAINSAMYVFCVINTFLADKFTPPQEEEPTE